MLSNASNLHFSLQHPTKALEHHTVMPLHPSDCDLASRLPTRHRFDLDFKPESHFGIVAGLLRVLMACLSSRSARPDYFLTEPEPCGDARFPHPFQRQLGKRIIYSLPTNERGQWQLKNLV